MPDHPQCSVTTPAEVFRETFLYWIEDKEHHETMRRLGGLLDQLVGEAALVVRNKRQKGPDPTWVVATVRAVLLDLDAARFVLADIAENLGAAVPANEVRLMLAVVDLMPEFDAFIGKLREAFAVATPGAGLSA